MRLFGRGQRHALDRDGRRVSRSRLVGSVAVVAILSPMLVGGVPSEATSAAPLGFSGEVSLDPQYPCVWSDNGGEPCDGELAGEISGELEGDGWSATLIDASIHSEFPFVAASCKSSAAAGSLTVRASSGGVSGEFDPDDGPPEEVIGLAARVDFEWSQQGSAALDLILSDGSVELLTPGLGWVPVMDEALGHGAGTFVIDATDFDPRACERHTLGFEPGPATAQVTGTLALAET